MMIKLMMIKARLATFSIHATMFHCLYVRRASVKRGKVPKRRQTSGGGEKGGEVYERAEGDQAKDARKRTRDEQQSWSHLDKLENLSHIPR